MTDAFDPSTLPPRMLASEVCEVARISKATLYRRIADGSLDLKPVDRGREKIFSRADVIRALGLGGTPAPTQAERPAGAIGDPATFRARFEEARRQQRKPPRPKQVQPEPLKPSEHHAVMLSVRPGVRVDLREDGRYDVVFVARANARASTWPDRITLPRAAPGPLALLDRAEFEALASEAAAVRAECQAALNHERGREGRKAAR